MNIQSFYLDRDVYLIVTAVAAHYDVLPTDIIGSGKKPARLSEIRQMCCVIITDLLQTSLAQTGRGLGLDHTSVKYALSQSGVRKKSDPLYANEIEALRLEVRSILDEAKLQTFTGDDGPRVEVLDIMRRILRSPRGQIRISAAEIRQLAEAHFDIILCNAGGPE